MGFVLSKLLIKLKFVHSIPNFEVILIILLGYMTYALAHLQALELSGDVS